MDYMVRSQVFVKKGNPQSFLVVNSLHWANLLVGRQSVEFTNKFENEKR